MMLLGLLLLVVLFVHTFESSDRVLLFHFGVGVLLIGSLSKQGRSTTETIEGLSLSLESIDDIEGVVVVLVGMVAFPGSGKARTFG